MTYSQRLLWQPKNLFICHKSLKKKHTILITSPVVLPLILSALLGTFVYIIIERRFYRFSNTLIKSENNSDFILSRSSDLSDETLYQTDHHLVLCVNYVTLITVQSVLYSIDSDYSSSTFEFFYDRPFCQII